MGTGACSALSGTFCSRLYGGENPSSSAAVHYQKWPGGALNQFISGSMIRFLEMPIRKPDGSSGIDGYSFFRVKGRPSVLIFEVIRR